MLFELQRSIIIGMKTEFQDRAGNDIYIGDIVQYRLSTLTQGPTLLRVVRNKKGVVKLADPRNPENNGMVLRKNYQKYLTIVDKSVREI